jgi:hypothetical protein
MLDLVRDHVQCTLASLAHYLHQTPVQHLQEEAE